ncbi:MAG: SDR family NAD(P)-dependent oxidoreductase [Clostridium sp.]|nr:SDR family NAD(P)-dependent oxidoreductase [Prevotella sp.]MCM1428554.1 SDR family NAD(P)-dependent oxidoreductase [Clostridium sp.]MCM1475018.1 SDR family NAD(P)-dependent oxidoreductase [Muribaculaceae bacterium]
MRDKDNKKVLKGRWAVVTGAEGGIGREFCCELASMGCGIVAVGIQDGSLYELVESIAAEFGTPIVPLRLDLTSEQATLRLMEFLEFKEIMPYILINNAGIFSFREVAETSDKKIAMFIDLHVRSLTELTVKMARKMKSLGEGKILNMSSMSCWMPMPGIALYSATKSYIRVFTRAMAYEMQDSGVTMTVACPGGIATDLFGLAENIKKLAVRIKVLDTPKSFAHKAIKKMLKGKKQYINGWLNKIAIPIVAATPTRLRLQIKHRMLDKGITR